MMCYFFRKNIIYRFIPQIYVSSNHVFEVLFSLSQVLLTVTMMLNGIPMNNLAV
jgi:hypothetical protein